MNHLSLQQALGKLDEGAIISHGDFVFFKHTKRKRIVRPDGKKATASFTENIVIDLFEQRYTKELYYNLATTDQYHFALYNVEVAT